MSTFVEILAPHAIRYGTIANVLPSLIIAQGILESASGTSHLAKNSNNLFGIKKGTGWDGEVFSVLTSEYDKEENYYETVAEFRKYPSYEGAVIDLVGKYVYGLPKESKNRYEKVLGERDFTKLVQIVKDAGYATDPNYPQKLINIYNAYNLGQYDDPRTNLEKEETKMVKIAIDAGHGVNTPGKRTPVGEREWTFNNLVALAAISELNTYQNVQILRVDDPTGKTDVSLNSRAAKANSWGADIYISIHHNANTGKWGTWTGAETYVMQGSSSTSNSMKLAKLVHPRIVSAMGIKNRGIKQANFAVLRQTSMPAILTEGGYMDSSIDIVKMRNANVMKNQGKGIATGAALYFGLKKKASAPSTPAPPEAKGYLEYGDRGDRVKAMQEYLNRLGFKCEITGFYNAETKRAVMLFQEARGIKVDGIYGPGSLAEMNKALKEPSKPAYVPPSNLYRVRASWGDESSQLGAFSELQGAKELADKNPTHKVFNESGQVVYDPKEEAAKVAENQERAKAKEQYNEDFQKAISLGITDGSKPYEAPTREQVAVMIVRALNLNK